MHVVIFALDRHNAVDVRLSNYDAHKAYLAAAAVNILVSGPLLSDDNETMIGSMFLLEVDSLDDAMAFNRADPFFHARLWQHVEIRPFLKRVDKR